MNNLHKTISVRELEGLVLNHTTPPIGYKLCCDKGNLNAAIGTTVLSFNGPVRTDEHYYLKPYPMFEFYCAARNYVHAPNPTSRTLMEEAFAADGSRSTLIDVLVTNEKDCAPFMEAFWYEVMSGTGIEGLWSVGDDNYRLCLFVWAALIAETIE